MKKKYYIFSIIFFTTFFSLTSVGYLPSDPGSRYFVSESLIKYGSVLLKDPIPTNYVFNVVIFENNKYAVFFPGQSIVFLPFATLSVTLQNIVGSHSDFISRVIQFLISTFFIPFIGALSVAGTISTLRLLKVSWSISFFISIIIGIASPLWIYSGQASEEIILATLGIWSLYFAEKSNIYLLKKNIAKFINNFFISITLLNIGILHRSTFAGVVIAILLIYSVKSIKIIAYFSKLERSLQGNNPKIFSWIAINTVIFSIIPFYNFLRFKNPFDTGYNLYYQPHGGIFSTDFTTGFLGHLFSPGKSIFIYIPWVILVVFSLPYLLKKYKYISAIVMIALSFHFFIYSRFTFWGGDPISWGVRFHVYLIPLLSVALGLWLDSFWVCENNNFKKNVVKTIICLSALVQLIGATFVVHLEHIQHPEYLKGITHQIPDKNAWTWDCSQFKLRLDNIYKKINGEKLIRDVSTAQKDQLSSAESWNLFPLRIDSVLKNSKITIIMWILWFFLFFVSLLSFQKMFYFFSILRKEEQVGTK